MKLQVGEMRKIMVDFVHHLQDEICASISQIDNNTFREDKWEREEGGGGRSRVFSGGNVSKRQA